MAAERPREAAYGGGGPSEADGEEETARKISHGFLFTFLSMPDTSFVLFQYSVGVLHDPKFE